MEISAYKHSIHQKMKLIPQSDTFGLQAVLIKFHPSVCFSLFIICSTFFACLVLGKRLKAFVTVGGHKN